MSRKYYSNFTYSSFQDETVNFFSAIEIPYDNTVYFGSTAYEITGRQLWEGLDLFIVTGKLANWWIKLTAFYPIIGGTASKHSRNVINPADLDAAGRITWFGGVTHSATGVLGNGINGYASFNRRSANIFAANNYQAAVYVRTNNTPPQDGTGVIMGGFNSVTENFIMTHNANGLRNYSNTFAGVAVHNQVDKKGFIVGGKNAPGYNYIYKNGVLVASGTGGGTLSPNPGNMLLFTFGIGVNPYTDEFDNNEYSTIIHSAAMDATENLSLKNAVQALQTALHRQVAI